MKPQEEMQVDLTDRERVDRVTIALRRLQIKLWQKSRESAAITTAAGRAETERQAGDHLFVGLLALALEENRVVILPPTEDTYAKRMADDVDRNFGETEEPDEGSRDGAPEAPSN